MIKCENRMLYKRVQLQVVKFGFNSCGSVTFRFTQLCSRFGFMRVSGQAFNKRNSIFYMGLYSLNSMIAEFSKNGDLISARQLFDQMPHRDTVSWNSLMAGYAQNNQPNHVLQLASEMQNHDSPPNQTTFSTALSACAKLGALDQGKQLHGFSIKNCFSTNVFVGTALITMYAKCKVFYCIIKVFDGINQKNLAAWNALISGYILNFRMEEAQRVFDKMPDRNVISWTALIKGYVEMKQVRNAFQLFNSMPNKNLISWSVMISGFIRDGQYEKALELFIQMLGHGIKPSKVTISSIISACSGLKNPQSGMNIHGYAIKFGFDLDEIVVASLVNMYSKCFPIEEARFEFEKFPAKYTGAWNSMISGYIDNDQVDKAQKLFDKMPEPDVISWNSIINGYLRNTRIGDALELYSRMPEPTVETRTSLMSCFIENARLDDARKVFDEMPQKDLVAFTTMISGYMEQGLLDDARDLFDQMPERNVVVYNVMISGLIQHRRIIEANKLFYESTEHDLVTWSTMIIGYANLGLNEDAFKLYVEMIRSNLSPNRSIITSLVSSCSSFSLLNQGQQFHVVIVKFGLEPCLVVSNSLINMYGKCGDIFIAQQIFDRMPDHDLVTWNALIHGYAMNGHGKQGIEMFEKMQRRGIKPDDVTFLSVLSACSHRGQLGEAQNYFNSMRTNHGIMPRLAHYACMVDLLCRIGLVEEAEKLICSMPFEPDAKIWTSLLGGCKLNCRVEIAEHAASELLALNSRDPVPYLHLGSIYRTAGRWADMENLRMEMDELGMNKPPGCSWIEVRG